MITEHFATDVPSLTWIVLPEEHSGKLIESVRVNTETCEAIYTIRDGEPVRIPTWMKVSVRSGPERHARLAYVRALLGQTD